MSELLDHVACRIAAARPVASAIDALSAGRDFTLAAPALARPALTATIFATHPRPILVALAGEDAAERFARQLASLLAPEQVLHLPARADMPWSAEAPDLSTVGRRGRALWSLAKGRPVVVVASARALMRRVPPRDAQVFEPLVLAPGAELDLAAAAARLTRMGYERAAAAEVRGSFAVRGGVLDVFASDASAPVRAELFGDTVETLRRFVPSTGQPVGDAGPVEVYPCREVMLGTRAAQHAERALAALATRDEEVARRLEMMREGVYFDGVEAHLPHLYRSPGAVTDHVHPSALVVVSEPRALFDDSVRHAEEIEGRARAAGAHAAGLFLGPAELDLGDRQRLTLLSLLRSRGVVDAELAARAPEVAGGEQRFAGGIRALLEAGNDVVLAAPEREARARAVDLLTAAGLSVTSLSEEPGPLRPGVVSVSRADVPAGFVMPEARLAVVSIEDAFPRRAAAARREARGAQAAFDPAPGDHVVHERYGVARFVEVVRKEAGGAVGDYLLLEYAAGDRLYVPVGHADRVTKYVGPDGASPRVTRLNTSDWSRATKKARAAAKRLAFDLVDLYARRAAVRGHAFSPDTPWQMEMEAMFPFEETPDQLAAIADVKADMESDRPMDRLICGDVGYGKTEVAIRAAFKAVQDGRQVMVLCPTTILAQQHFTTFSERFAPFPVRVEVISRFRDRADQAATLRAFAEGGVDVLIGTHRLLSRDVAPRSLGLVVVDEEQRFGVESKEHLKNLREQVDVLTLSATPIPRTLQMSLSGVRDMSVIDTPPPNRFPVKVHVGEYDAAMVAAAIRNELARGGQVYYVSNRVRTIDDAVERVRRAAPEARVLFAHGRMSERELERVMESFAANEADVLVATTIIESGIDNPHSNTLVIEDSQRLGLAQLYQLKGRVGRSHVRAFAYFLFPRTEALTDQAVDRLMAIREHDELGSGIRVALRDLEIRGAGSLLGAEQSGSLSAVGFDLYAAMIRDAVSEARGEPALAVPDVRVEIPVPAYLPEGYVPDPAQRVRWYRQLAAAATPEAVGAVARGLAERHGDLPEEALALLGVARLRAMACEAGVSSVVVSRHKARVQRPALEDRAREAAAAIGAVWSSRESALTLALRPGEAVVPAVERLLDAILAVSPGPGSGASASEGP